MRQWMSAIAVCTALHATALAGEGQGPSADAPKALVVEVVNAEGRPIEGADIGLGVRFGSGGPKDGAPEAPEWSYAGDHARSDPSGIARLADADSLERFCLFARHADRQIAAIANVDREKVDGPIRLTLLPERDIVAVVTCGDLEGRGQALGWVHVAVNVGGKQAVRARFNLAATELVRMPLPPGDYDLVASAYNTHDAQRALHVVADKTPQQVETIELPATNLALLEGQPAPEIPGVLAWKNGNPGTLADLRGKVVLLEFWGYWCGPCVGGMPELIAMDDKYRDQGLVIIGIHMDLSAFGEPAVTTAAKLDELLTATRRELWDGRDIPFPVALVASRPTPFRDGLAQKSPSHATALYGITGVPTKVLIDRQGKVAGRFPSNEDGIRLLKKALREK